MGYGQIYNTTWWGNALDTARTAGTEPDFFGSQMKLLTSEQPELVTNGDFATDSDWTKGTGTTISGGNANFVNATGVSLYQNIGTQTGTVKVEFTVTNYTSGTLNVYSGGNQGAGTVNVSANALGTYIAYVVRTGGNNNVIFGSINNFVGSIDNVSVKEARLELDQIEAKKCLADWIHVTALQDLNN